MVFLFFRASKLLDDGPALKFYQQWMRQVMSHRVSLVAVIDDDSPRPQIVAMQCLLVETKGDRLFHPDVSILLNPFHIKNIKLS